MSNILERIKKQLLNWPYATAESHRVGGIESRLNKREMGYMHGDRLVDLPFPMNTRYELVNSDRASPHHVLPRSGCVSYWINKGEKDVPAVVEFLKLVIMATGMVFFMTLFMTLLREGLTLDFHIRWINQFLFALVIVFPIALGMSQIANKVVFRIMRQKGQVVLP